MINRIDGLRYVVVAQVLVAATFWACSLAFARVDESVTCGQGSLTGENQVCFGMEQPGSGGSEGDPSDGDEKTKKVGLKQWNPYPGFLESKTGSSWYVMPFGVATSLFGRWVDLYGGSVLLGTPE